MGSNERPQFEDPGQICGLQSRVGFNEGAIHECSFAQNCVRICPKSIPLTTSISIVYGQVMKKAILDLFRK
jgi:succinate dehydrogenase / fumarate reductase iron-sulfur subunit